jgi:hypothetical protein
MLTAVQMWVSMDEWHEDPNVIHKRFN